MLGGEVNARVAVLAVALGAALGLWFFTRTQRGAAVLETVADFVGDVVSGPRGIRNNNPGNIDWIENPAKRWRGMIRKETPQEGGRFGVFDTPANGVRAIAQELLVDERRGIRTVAGLVGNWAPPGENNTPAYVAAVARAAGVDSDDAIDVRSYLPRLVAAIIEHENGVQPYSADQLQEWVYS